MKSNKSGFTIVEMLVVVAIIAILAGAITMGVNGMFYKSRVGRAKSMRAMLQSGLETFYARTGEWPSPIKDIAEKIKGLTKQDIISAANGIALHTVYKLLPKEKN